LASAKPDVDAIWDCAPAHVLLLAPSSSQPGVDVFRPFKNAEAG
jgi:hypothetical protein